MKVWEADERFVPNGVYGWKAGDYKPAVTPRWHWNGSTVVGDGYVYLDLFYHWGTIDQQTMLETAVGKIFSVMSHYNPPVIQISGTTVAVKHCFPGDEPFVCRFQSQKTMLGNLFNALLKMIEVEWLPQHRSKDGTYYWTVDNKNRADHGYELGVLVAAKKTIEAKIAKVTPPATATQAELPRTDPFADNAYMNPGGLSDELLRLRSDLAEMNKAIGSKEGVISSLAWQSWV